MGWVHEDPKHEGFLVALVPTKDARGWVELFVGHPDSDKDLELKMFAVGCECGWRSERFHAPLGTGYVSHIVLTAHDVEEEARELWCHHVETLRSGRA